MTSVSGITIVTAPCCGADYQQAAFASIRKSEPGTFNPNPAIEIG